MVPFYSLGEADEQITQELILFKQSEYHPPKTLNLSSLIFKKYMKKQIELEMALIVWLFNTNEILRFNVP